MGQDQTAEAVAADAAAVAGTTHDLDPDPEAAGIEWLLRCDDDDAGAVERDRPAGDTPR